MITTIFILKIVLTFAFGAASIMTLVGSKSFTKLYKEFHLNRLAMILVSIIEIGLVILLFVNTFAFYASIGLAYVTTAAIYKHIKIKHPFRTYIPATLLLILSMWLAMMLMNPS